MRCRDGKLKGENAWSREKDEEVNLYYTYMDKPVTRCGSTLLSTFASDWEPLVFSSLYTCFSRSPCLHRLLPFTSESNPGP
jgi:hypothetical protein